MKKITAGILAHVDSGKTTLTEELLYLSGQIRKKGRVDAKTSFMDTDEIEKERGITVFSKQAVLSVSDSEITLIDTPGHIDFSSETERALGVLDYAILVISGTDGVQSHTKTLWELLKSHNIPVFVFVNKTDITNYTKEALLKNLKEKLSDRIISFSDFSDPAFYENLSLTSEDLLKSYLENGSLSDDEIALSIKKREVFPCYFGSALKSVMTKEFLDGFVKFTKMDDLRNDFGAKVYKITEDSSGNRLTHLKITGGVIEVKAVVSGVGKNSNPWEEKINQIRIYSGDKFKTVKSATQGETVTVTGLKNTYPGEGLGFEKNSPELTLEPVFYYAVKVKNGVSAKVVLKSLKKLEEEETNLNVSSDADTGEIKIGLMGEVQSEVLRKVLKSRFGIDAEFEKGSIIYKETIKSVAEGVGHFEPLRHYAEVHLILSPLKRGEGLKFESIAKEDSLSKNWQRLILTHLEEKTHKGVLTGSPITDMKITLASGKAHLKHTEGGDFRQATYRAVRNGLMNAENVLLEPWYSFTMEIPSESVGRAMTDIDFMGGDITPPELNGETSVLKGFAPAKDISEYQKEITVYTKGKGKISFSVSDYRPVKNQEEIVCAIGYDPEADILNTPDSIFCANGSGFTVKWDEVKSHMHLESALKEEPEEKEPVIRKQNLFSSEEELISIFEKTYGKIERKLPAKMATQKPEIPAKYKKPAKVYKKNYLLVDGYNIIFAWDELKNLAKESLEYARYTQINKLSVYKIIRNTELILVFDAYKVKGNRGEQEKIHGINVVYTKEAETADAYIEKVTHTLSKDNKVRVATSDGLEQLIILGNGAFRVPASSFIKEVEDSISELEQLIASTNRENGKINSID